jgi:hypothetical protein
MAGPYAAAAGPMPYVAGPYSSTDPYAAGPPGGPRMPGQFGQNQRDTGSWQAAGPQSGPGWGPGQGPPGPNMRNTGSWQAAAAAQSQDWAAQQPPDWAAQQAPYGPGGGASANWQAGPGFGANPRNTGSWQAAGPEQGQGWAPGPGTAQGVRNTGSWQAAGPQPGSGWIPGQEQYGQGQFGQGAQFGQGQFGEGIRNTGAWQAAGPSAGQGWAGAAQQPYPGQPYPGQPYAGAGGPGMRNTGGFSRVGSPVIRQRDSALPDPPPSAKGPVAAIETDNIAAFARDLRVLRSKVGLDYPEMAEKSHYTMRTLASAAGGLRLPTLPVLIAYVNACGGDVGDWEERWGRLTKSGKKGHAALTAGDGAAGSQPGQPGQPGQGPIPQGARQTGEIYVITSARPRDAQW